MAGDPFELQVGARHESREQRPGHVELEPELGVVKARCDVRVRVRVDVRVHAERQRRHRAPVPRDRLERVDLGDALHVDGADPRVERHRELAVGLSDAGEDDLGRIEAGLEAPGELAPRDDVRAAAAPREPFEDREVAVRLDRVGDEGGAAGRASSWS